MLAHLHQRHVLMFVFKVVQCTAINHFNHRFHEFLNEIFICCKLFYTKNLLKIYFSNNCFLFLIKHKSENSRKNIFFIWRKNQTKLKNFGLRNDFRFKNEAFVCYPKYEHSFRLLRKYFRRSYFDACWILPDYLI